MRPSKTLPPSDGTYLSSPYVEVPPGESGSKKSYTKTVWGLGRDGKVVFTVNAISVVFTLVEKGNKLGSVKLRFVGRANAAKSKS